MKYGSIVMAAILSIGFCSTVQSQWVKTNGPNGGNVYCLAVSGTNLFAGTNGGVFRSTDNGVSWTAANAGLRQDSVVSSFAVSDTNLFAGTQGGGVFLSTDSGTSWTQASTGLPTTPVWSLAVSGTNLFAGTGDHGVFISTNNGTSWGAVNTGFTRTRYDTTAYTPVMAFAVSPNGGGGTNLFAGTGDAPSGNSEGGVFLSTNNGTSWTASGLTDYYVSALAVSPNGTGGTNLFAGTTVFLGGSHASWVSLSTNNGASWTGINAELGRSIVSALAISPNGRGGTNLFAGTGGGGVLISTDNGTSWTPANAGLPDSLPGWITAFAVIPNGSGAINLFAATNVNGVWRRPLSEMVTGVDMSSTEIPELFGLEQNYPNPFNPSTTIRYGLPHQSSVQLAVFNTLGQQVTLLASGEQEAGYHEVRFDASGLSSGMYFYRIQAGDFVQTRKLLLIR